MAVGYRLGGVLLAALALGVVSVHATPDATTPARVEPPGTKALLVGISDYGYDAGWVDLHGGNDVEVLQAALVHRGFSPSTIRTLRDAQATKQNVLQEIEEHLMSDSVGRSVVLHFSVHGQRIDDLDGDEGDGLDEALVLYGAPSRAVAGYHGERHLTDDTLASTLTRLRRAVGPHGTVSVIVDACHSAAATRTALPVRGTAAPISLIHSSGPISPSDWPSGFRDVTPFHEEAALAPMVFFSAARSGEAAHETLASDGRTVVGAFTNTLVEVLLHERHLQAWGDVADVVGARVSGAIPGQHPQLTGPRDLQVFSSARIPVERSVPVLSRIAPTRLALGGGTLVGLAEGAIVSIHAAGTRRPTDASRLAQGHLVRASVLQAEVVLDDPIESGTAEGARAVLEAPALATAAVAVALHESLPERVAWAEALRGDPWVRVAAAAYPGVYLVEPNPGHAGERAGEVVLRDPNDLGRELEVQAVGTDVGRGAIVNRLQGLARTALIRNAAVSSADHRAQVELSPARSTGPESCLAVGPAYRQTEGRSVIEVDSSTLRAHAQLSVSNRGKAASFATVIAVDGRGWTCQLYPKRDEHPERLAPGDTASVCLVPDLEPGQATWEGELWVFNMPGELDLGSVMGRSPDCGQAHSTGTVRGAGGASRAATLRRLVDLSWHGSRRRGLDVNTVQPVGHVQVLPLVVRIAPSNSSTEL